MFVKMCKSFASCILVVVNLIFALIGATLVIIGALLEWGKPTLQGMMNSLYIGFGFRDVTAHQIITVLGQYINVLSSSGVIIFGIGCILFGICFAGCCGICCKSRVLLGFYVSVVIAILIAMITFTIIFGVKRPELKEQGGIQYMKLLQKYYVMTYEEIKRDASGFTGIVDLIQARLQCCGAFNHTDLPRNGNYTGTVPISCCIMENAMSLRPKYWSCIKNLSTDSSNYNQGCYTKLWVVLDAFAEYAIYTMLGLCSILFLFVVLGVFMLYRFGKDVVAVEP